MRKTISAHNISIEILENKSTIKYDVNYSDIGQIVVTKKQKRDWTNHAIMQGKITIGSYVHDFPIFLDIWNLEDYQYQWQTGLERLNTYDKSCLITKIHKVRGLNSMEWWLLYKINNTIHVQHRFLLGSMYATMVDARKFTPKTCYNFIPEREVYEDDGEKIPEIIIK